MISVIILVKNDEDNLHICLNSLLKQSFDDFEVICINDYSVDSSAEILEYFSKKDSRIKIFNNDNEKGFEYCKNKGLNIAKYDKKVLLKPNEWLSFNTLKIFSEKDEKIFESNLSNDISEFRKGTTEIIWQSDINEEVIHNLKNEKTVLQKKLGKYTKKKILEKIIKQDYSNLTIAIKSPHPKNTKHWGDLFFSIALKKAFEKIGFNVIIQEREHWYDKTDIDIALVLRGLVDYDVDYSNMNIMWNISHPDLILKEEYEKYDYVFISSLNYADKIKNKVNTNVSALLQCTDPEIFYHEIDSNITDEILFVGVTRGVYRDIVKDVIKTNHDISVYGRGWEKFIDKKYIKGKFIQNEELHKFYSSCKILLNDHWKDMREWDFPSNRLFDALACGTFVISDKIPSAETIFDNSIITYENIEDLNEKINYYLSHEDERVKIANKGKKIVLEKHTFDMRVNEILEALKRINIDSLSNK